MYLFVIVDFSQPLLARKNELDKLRKDIKEQWQKEQKKMVCNMSLFRSVLLNIHAIRSVGILIVSLTGQHSTVNVTVLSVSQEIVRHINVSVVKFMLYSSENRN